MKSLVVIPTYNEKESISQIIPEIFSTVGPVHILVVDDNSPDGTGAVVKELAKKHPEIHLLERPGKQGLGRAYLAGFDWALKHGYEFVVEMDADFSHRPLDLKNILKAGEAGAEVVVGSRYVKGGGTQNWGLGRKILSRGGGIYSRLILGFPLQDWTGGFNGWKRNVLQAIELEKVKSEGYSFQIELKYRALKKGFKISEIPILFEERRVGQSKMSSKIVVEAFLRVWKLRLQI
ncbi:MAG: polyprenol monophosphomannose synthase [Bdellovibrionales bacterium]